MSEPDAELPIDGAEDDLELFRDPAHEPQPDLPVRRRKRRRIIAVTGAKGGVGKTLLAANLGIYLATIGRQVVVVDADPGLANLHTCLGSQRPVTTSTYLPPLPTFLRATDVNLDAFGPSRTIERRGNAVVVPPLPMPVPQGRIVETPVPGLATLHLGVDEVPPGRKRRVSRRSIREHVDRIDAEYVVVDLGSGIDAPLLDFVATVDLALFVAIPEPSSIENTYTFMRHLFARTLRRSVPKEDRERLHGWLTKLGHAPAPLDLVRHLEAAGDPLADRVRKHVEAFEFRMVFNQTRLRSDLELGDRMRSASIRRLGLTPSYLGYVDHDDTVWTCIRSQRPLLVEYPGTKASKSIEKIARRLLALDAQKERPRLERSVPVDTHHDLLEVERGATDEEIRRAYKRAKEVYDRDSLCCYGLFDGPGLDALRARIDEAYDVLLDPSRRRPYELSVFPPEVAQTPSRDGIAAQAPTSPAPPITPDTEFRGPLIRAVRESLGLELRDLSQKTKIGQGYLRAIEDDDFASLPALVYVRGFVFEVAKVLRLDPEQVSRTYTKHYKRFIEEQEKP